MYKLWGLALLDDETQEKTKTLVYKDVVSIYGLSHADSDLIQDRQVLQMTEPCLLSDIFLMLYPLLNYFMIHPGIQFQTSQLFGMTPTIK